LGLQASFIVGGVRIGKVPNVNKGTLSNTAGARCAAVGTIRGLVQGQIADVGDCAAPCEDAVLDLSDC
jgi:hypothetical protein